MPHEEPIRNELRNTLHEYIDASIVLGGSRDDLETWEAARAKSEILHTKIWSIIEHASHSGVSNSTLLIDSANKVIDIHEIRMASIENYLPVSLLLLLLGVAAVATSFIAWSFGAATHRSRRPILMLGVIITAVLLLIMDMNRPQRGMISVGVDTLVRTQEDSASEQWTR